jgi:hypothetical protein
MRASKPVHKFHNSETFFFAGVFCGIPPETEKPNPHAPE